MITRICLMLALLTAIPAWSQVSGTDEEEPDNPVLNSGSAMTPPPVSGQAYSTQTGDEVRVNFLSLGLAAQMAYDDNVQAGYGTTPEADYIYSIWPSITIDKSTVRVREQFRYSPGFTFYQPSTLFNSSDQNASLNFQYHPTANATVSLQDTFIKSSSLFNQPFDLSAGNVTASNPSQATGAIAAFANRISNGASAEVADELGSNTELGLSAQFGLLDYPESSQVPGLFNSASYGGSGFFSQRLTSRQYLGVNYQHVRTVSYLKGEDSELTTDNYFPFYTLYLRSGRQSTLSISLSGGPQHYVATEAPSPQVKAWEPGGTVGVGWQGHRSSFAASYSRSATGGGGLPGAYEENRANAFIRRELALNWDLNLAGLYAINKNVTNFAFSEPGGHTVTGTASVDHLINRSLKIEIGYDRLEQSYEGIQALTTVPNSNREYGSITYLLTRPLGR